MGYKKHDQQSRKVSTNYRKGKTKKTVSTKNGKITIEVPRDDAASFEPKIVKKHERNIARIRRSNSFLVFKRNVYKRYTRHYLSNVLLRFR